MRTDDAIKSAVQQWISANRSEATARDLTQLYATSATVGACADFRADMISQVPMKIQRRKETVDEDHPLSRMFSGTYSFPNLMRRSELAMSFWGRNLLHKRRNAFNVPVRLDWVNPNIYSTDVYMDGGLRGFRIYASSMYHIEHISRIDADDAVYMHGVDFDDDYDGIGEVERAFLEASIEPEKAQTQLAVFRNMAFLGGIAQPAENNGGSKIEAADKDNLVGFLRRVVKGAAGAGTFLVSPKRWEWLTLQAPLKDLALKEIADDVRLSVCVAFRMPLELIVPSAANYAQFEGARRTWGHAWLVPRAEWYASVLTEQLASEFGDEWKIVPDFDAVPFLKEDAASRVSAVKAKVDGTLISLYDAQKELGDEPDDQLKDLYMVAGVPTPRTELKNMWRYQRLIAPSVYNSELITGEPLPQPVDPNAVVPTDAGGQPVGGAPLTTTAAPVIDSTKDDAGKSLCIMLDLSENADLIGLQARLRQLYAGQVVEWNKPNDLHLTVLVAPAATDEQIEAVKSALEYDIDIPALTLGIGSLKAFDNLGNHALHFRVKRNAALLEFHKVVYDTCLEAGIAISTTSSPVNYIPHITMGYMTTKPNSVIYGSKMAVETKGVLLSVDGETIWRSVDSDLTPAHLPEKAPLATRSYLPDPQFKELQNWQRIIERTSDYRYAFKTKALPAVVSSYVHLALEDGDDLAFIFEAARKYAGEVAGKSYGDTKAGFVAEMVRVIGAGQASETSRQQFSAAMRSALRRYGLIAFRDGMNAEGADPESFSPEQLAAFRAWQEETSSYISGLAAELFKEGGITENEIGVRAEAWANKSLRDVYYRGAALIAAEKPKRWKRNPQKDSCSDCIERDGKVLTYKEWSKVGLPGDTRLACHGDHCGCELEDAA